MTASVEAPVSNVGLLHDTCTKYLDDAIANGTAEAQEHEGYLAESVRTPSGLFIQRVGTFMGITHDPEIQGIKPGAEIEYWGNLSVDVYLLRRDRRAGNTVRRKSMAEEQHNRVAGDLLALIQRA